MRKKMNAFTLIELLAVIVILAIIALIATPIILGIVEDAKKDAFLRSVELVISTTDMDITSKTYEKEYTYNIVEGNISNLEIGVKNTEGMNGNITYDIEGKEEYAIHNGVYCVKKTNTMNRPEISDYQGYCGLETNPKCFKFSNGRITNYYDNEENNSSNKECPRDVVIPETINGATVTSIGNNAFQSKKITSVRFPNTLEKVGEYTFADNKLSGELDLSNTQVTWIGQYAFSGDKAGSGNQINSVIFPNTLESIDSYAFRYNKLSGELDLSNTQLTRTGWSAFAGSEDGKTNQITSVKFPNSLTDITFGSFDYNAISGDLDLSYLTNLTKVSGFVGNQITHVKFPSSVTTLDGFAYNKLKGELDLSNTQVTSIVGGAFQGTYDRVTNQITHVKFPSTLESIGIKAFANNKLSGELDLSNTKLTIILQSAFSMNDITMVNLSTNITSIGNSAFTSNAISGELDLSNTNLISIGDDAFLGGENGDGNQITSVNFPNTLESIGERAFKWNNLSEELDLSNTKITNIGPSAFSNNKITSVKFPSSLESIEGYAFDHNALSGKLELSHLTNLTKIGARSFSYNKLSGELDLSNTQITSIGNYAFGDELSNDTNKIASIKFPNTLESIGKYAFYYNALTSVTFYGRSDLTGVTVGSSAWGWASGYNADNNIYFINE